MDVNVSAALVSHYDTQQKTWHNMLRFKVLWFNVSVSGKA